eukprot:TRINITY_DN2691_c0_g2_i1.p1 TRINITY_DN2691_c0_g2~~TRINITY_DN2691_c0_g2_i1.p1  ORF type:complete len:928 (-),score=163.82 TRINITY_DN2691_c0_g2_i1:356-3025(-)
MASSRRTPTPAAAAAAVSRVMLAVYFRSRPVSPDVDPQGHRRLTALDVADAVRRLLPPDCRLNGVVGCVEESHCFRVTLAHPAHVSHCVLREVCVYGYLGTVKHWLCNPRDDLLLEEALAPTQLQPQTIKVIVLSEPAVIPTDTPVCIEFKVANHHDAALKVSFVKVVGHNMFTPRNHIKWPIFIKPANGEKLSFVFKSPTPGIFPLLLVIYTEIGEKYFLKSYKVDAPPLPPIVKKEEDHRHHEQPHPPLVIEFFASEAEAAVSDIHNRYVPCNLVSEPKEYHIPDYMLNAFQTQLPHPWKCPQHHRERLHELLWIEELQVLRDLQQYIRFRTNLGCSFDETRSSDGTLLTCQLTYSLKLEGIAENRPSVARHDEIFALDVDRNFEYKGYVIGLNSENILIQFPKQFSETFKMEKKYTIRFQPSRSDVRMRHWAVDNTSLELIWPTLMGPPTPATVPCIPAVSPQLYLVPQHHKVVTFDNDQRLFMQTFLRSNTKHPLILSGPFGSGKTEVLFEIIQGILLQENTCILISTPVNSSADAFVQGISKMYSGYPDKLKETVFRFIDFRRWKKTVPRYVLNLTSYDESIEKFAVPPLEQLLKFRVVIATSVVSGYLSHVGVRKGHFSHIILDEAAQMSEADALIPLSLVGETTKVILAGDPKQSAPRLSSATARRLGLETSLLERLAQFPQYNLPPSAAENCFPLKVQLSWNYRSHPSIVQLCSDLFYEGRIKPVFKANDPKFSWLKTCDLFGDHPPVVFIENFSSETKIPESPSFFNEGEINLVVNLVAKLALYVPLWDIAIVSPYFLHTRKLREALKSGFQFQGVRVLNPDEIQGQEFKVVILSTVRSCPQMVEAYDLKCVPPRCCFSNFPLPSSPKWQTLALCFSLKI